MMGITTLKSKIRDFQHVKETRSRELNAEALPTNYTTGSLFRPYSSGRIVCTEFIRSNRTTFMKGTLYKEASGDEKQCFFLTTTLCATRNHHAGGIDLDLNLQTLLHHHTHIIFDWWHCKTIFYQSHDFHCNVYDCWFHLYAWVILFGLRASA